MIVTVNELLDEGYCIEETAAILQRCLAWHRQTAAAARTHATSGDMLEMVDDGFVFTLEQKNEADMLLDAHVELMNHRGYAQAALVMQVI